MKYENFARAIAIKSQMDKHSDLLNNLSSDRITVKVVDDKNWAIMTVGIWSDCEHPLREQAANFINQVIDYYTKEIEKLNEELLTL